MAGGLGWLMLETFKKESFSVFGMQKKISQLILVFWVVFKISK